MTSIMHQAIVATALLHEEKPVLSQVIFPDGSATSGNQCILRKRIRRVKDIEASRRSSEADGRLSAPAEPSIGSVLTDELSNSPEE